MATRMFDKNGKPMISSVIVGRKKETYINMRERECKVLIQLMERNILILLYDRNFIKADIVQLEDQCTNHKSVTTVEINLEFTYCA